MAKVLMVIAPYEFKHEEYFVSKKILEDAQIEVVTASTTKSATSTEDASVDAILLSEIGLIEGYDAFALIGGPGANELIDNQELHQIINAFNDQNKIVSAICISPVTLAKAGVLSNKKATVFPSGKDQLIELGVNYIEEDVVVDGNIITACGPQASQQYGETILKELSS